MKNFTSLLFNWTLTFAGFMLVIWLPYLISDLNILARHDFTTERNVKRIRTGMIALGIALAMVGIFENKISAFTDALHNWAAAGLGIIVLILAVSLYKLIPGFSREVVITSWVLAGLLVAGIIFVATGYFNTAGITLFGGVLAFTWISLFVSHVEHTAAELEPESFPS